MMLSNSINPMTWHGWSGWHGVCVVGWVSLGEFWNIIGLLISTWRFDRGWHAPFWCPCWQREMQGNARQMQADMLSGAEINIFHPTSSLEGKYMQNAYFYSCYMVAGMQDLHVPLRLLQDGIQGLHGSMLFFKPSAGVQACNICRCWYLNSSQHRPSMLKLWKKLEWNFILSSPWKGITKISGAWSENTIQYFGCARCQVLPEKVARDAAGATYVSDMMNHRIQRPGDL